MLKRLSTSAVTLLVAAAALGACVDAKRRFDEFDDRVPVVDASTVDRPQAPISDIDGTWYLAIKALGVNLHLFVTWDVDIDNAMLDGNYQPLAASNAAMPRIPVGGPLISNDVAIDETASFAAPLMGRIDGRANELTGNDLYPDPPVTKLVGLIQSTDVVCGTLAGAICVGGPPPCGGNGEPARLPIDGSTFAAVRVPDVNTLPALPPMDRCPE